MLNRFIAWLSPDIRLSQPLPMAKKTLPGYAFWLGTALIAFYALLLVFQSLFLLLGGSLSTIALWMALVTTLLVVIWFGWRLLKMHSWILVSGGVIFIAIIMGSSLVSRYFYDVSADGRDYHQRAIYQLDRGWNPIYRTLEPDQIYYNAWANHYPKATWIFASSFYQLTGRIETGKLYNWILIFSTGLIAYDVLRRVLLLRPWMAIIISVLLAANPVSIAQSLSFYNDGAVSSVVTMVILLIFAVIKSSDVFTLIAIACATILGLNIKFTATAYIEVLLGIMLLVVAILKGIDMRTAKNWQKKISHPTIQVLLSIIFGNIIALGIVGFNPYIINTFRYGNPFYPVYGSNQANKNSTVNGQMPNKGSIVNGQMPSNFYNKSQMEKLFLSVFSPSQNVANVPAVLLKTPFYITKNEISTLAGPDVRVSGWGPLFGGAIIIIFLCTLLLWIKTPRLALLSSALMIVIFAISLMNSEVWWARYSPQLWLIPVVGLGTLWSARPKWTTIAGLLLAFILIVNVGIIGNSVYQYVSRLTRGERITLASIQKNGNDVLLYEGPYIGVQYKFDEWLISYKIVNTKDDLPCPIQFMDFYYSQCK